MLGFTVNFGFCLVGELQLLSEVGFGLAVGFRHESSFGFALNFDLVLMFCFGCLCWFSGCVGCGGFWLLVLEFCWLWIRLLFGVFVVVV